MSTHDYNTRLRSNLPTVQRSRDSSRDAQVRLNSSFNESSGGSTDNSFTLLNTRINLPAISQSRMRVATPDRHRPRPPSVKRASDQGSRTPNHSSLDDKNFNINNYMDAKPNPYNTNPSQHIVRNSANMENNFFNSDSGYPLHFSQIGVKSSLDSTPQRSKALESSDDNIKIKFTLDEMSEDSALQQLNSKLQEDLSTLSDQFLDVFVENDRLQKLQKQMVIEQEKIVNQIKTEYDIIRIELESEKKIVEILLEQERARNQDLQALVQRLKDNLLLEREDKVQLLKEVQELKERLNEYLDSMANASGGAQAGLMDHNEKQRLLQQITHLRSELELCKILLIEKELKLETELSQRTELGLSIKRKTRYGRIYYIGQPRSFQDMLILLDKFDTFTMNSKERLVALEELCLYMNSSEEALAKLKGFKATIQCTRSLQSTNQAIVLRAMHLISFLCQDNESNASSVIEMGGISQIRQCLDSADQYTRIEAVAALEALSPFREATKIILKANTPVRLISLLEEGLQLETEYGRELSILAARTLSNLCLFNAGIKEIENNGGLYTILRCIRSENRNLRAIGVECLAHCSLDPRCRSLICDLRATKDIIQMLESHEPQVALNAAKALVNLSHKDQIKEDIRLEGGAKFIFRPLDYSDDEMRILILMILLNLCKYEKSALALCHHGLLTKLAMLMKATSNEIQRLSVNCISLILDSGIAPEYVYNNTDMTEIIDSLDVDDDLETAKFCFKIVMTFLLSPFTQKRITEHIEKIYYFARKLLDYDTDINNKLCCLEIIPKTLLAGRADIRAKLYENEIDITAAEILQQKIDIQKEGFSDVISALFRIFSSIAEQEYQDQRQNPEIKIAEKCIVDHNLLDNFTRLLEAYNQADRMDWDVKNIIIHTIEVYSHNDKNIAEFIENDITKMLMNTLRKAIEHKQANTIETVISCIAFYTNQQREWFTMCKPELVEILCSYLISPNKFMKERAKHCLYDLSFCPLLAHVVYSLPPSDALRPLLESYKDDPNHVGVILQNLCEDEAFKRQLIASLPHKIVLMGQGKDLYQMKFLERDEDGNLPALEKERIYVKRQLLDQTLANLEKFYSNLVHNKPKDRKGLIKEEDRIRDKIIEEMEQDYQRKDPLRAHQIRNYNDNMFKKTDHDVMNLGESVSQAGDDLRNTFFKSRGDGSEFVKTQESFAKTQGSFVKTQEGFRQSNFGRGRREADNAAQEFAERNSIETANQGVKTEEKVLPNKFINNLGEELRKLSRQNRDNKLDEKSKMNLSGQRNMTRLPKGIAPQKNPNEHFFTGATEGLPISSDAKNLLTNKMQPATHQGQNLDTQASRPNTNRDNYRGGLNTEGDSQDGYVDMEDGDSQYNTQGDYIGPQRGQPYQSENKGESQYTEPDNNYANAHSNH